MTMPLQTQIVPIVMRSGADTKEDSKTAPTGSLDRLVNATFQAPGKIQKRNGYEALSRDVLDSSADLTTAAGLATRAGELLLMDGTNAYSYDAPGDAWVNKGPLPSPTVSVTAGLAAGSSSIVGYDSAQHPDGLMMIAAEVWAPTYGAVGSTSAGIVYSVIDTTTGNVIVNQTAIASVKSPKVIVAGSYFVLFYVDASNALVAATLPVATPTAALTTAGTLSLNASTPNYDALYANTGHVYVIGCIATDSPANGYMLRTYAPSNFGSHVATVTKSSLYARAVSIVIDTYSGRPIAGWLNSSGLGIGFALYNSAVSLTEVTTGFMGNTSGPATALTMVSTESTDATGDNKSLICCYVTVPDTQCVPAFCGFGMSGTSNGMGRGSIQVAFIQGYAGSTLTYTLLRGVTLAGKALRYGSTVVPAGFVLPGSQTPAVPAPYVPVIFSAGESSHAADAVSTLFLVHGLTGQVVARLWQGTSVTRWFNTVSGVNTVPGMLPETTSLGDGVFTFPAGEVAQFSAPDATATTPALYQLVNAKQVTIDFGDPVNAYQGVEIADALLVSGGCPTAYDGNVTSEQGFNWSPYRIRVTNSSLGGVLAAGSYSYAAIYEWLDANGIVHWSGASATVAVTAVAGAQNTLSIPTLRTTRKTGVRVVIYRTIANGTVYYRLNNTGAAGTNDALLNSTSVNAVSFTDNVVTDTVLQQRAQLYTTGGVLENDPPPPLLCPTIHARRVIGIDASNRNTLWYSKQVAAGSPVEFSLAFQLSVSSLGGDTTAIASLDDKLIAFKIDRILMFTGQGPDSSGGQLDWSDSILVSTDTGCSAPKSIVVTPVGLMFQSPKGIYLLGRDLSVSYIGAPMEAYNGAAVLGAAMMPQVQQVRFQQAARTLVYDYGVGQWSVFETPAVGVDSLVWGGAHTYVTSAGLVAKETPGEHEDVGETFIPVRFTTSWISLAGIQGFQRVWRVLFAGTVSSETNVTVSLATDYDPDDGYVPLGGGMFLASSAQSATFEPLRSATGNWQERMHVTQQKSESIQIGFNEAQSDRANVYLDLSAITLEVGTKKGAGKLPASKSTG